jgi:hypothetical protein
MISLLLLAAATALAILAIANASADPATVGARATSSGDAPRAQACPGATLRLTLDAPAPATEAAIAEAPDLYGPHHDRVRADVAARARDAGARGRQVKAMCGRTIQRRTVVVSLFFPELRFSASLSQGTVFVSRFADGYHVWYVGH